MLTNIINNADSRNGEKVCRHSRDPWQAVQDDGEALADGQAHDLRDHLHRGSVPKSTRYIFT
jgi:hypothetical protein